jgi:hypothetical protein
MVSWKNEKRMSRAQPCWRPVIRPGFRVLQEMGGDLPRLILGGNRLRHPVSSMRIGVVILALCIRTLGPPA